MKVVFVTRGWPTKRNIMSGNYEAVQAKALAKFGIDVSLITIQRVSFLRLFSKMEIRKFIEDGVTVMTLPVALFKLPHNFGNEFFGINTALRRRALKKVYDAYRREKGDADILHAHIVDRAYDCKTVIDKYHVPLVITEHWSRMNKETLSKYEKSIGEAYGWANKVICVSKELSKSLHDKIGVNSVVIHNMVSDHFFETNIRTHTPANIVQFVSVGALIERKAFDVVISAMQQMNHKEQCQLYIIGSGEEEANLRKMIDKFNLHERVFLLGRKPPKEVSELIENSDCFILTSKLETFGIVYIEAMAKGKPVIATICGGPESFVNKSNGILIPTDNVEATSKAMDYMVENVDKYDNAAIRQYCHDNFSEEAISQKIVAVYKEVLEQ